MIRAFSCIAILMLSGAVVFGQYFNYSQFEKKFNAVIQKVYPACVRMYGVDTASKAQNSAQFSGVVVSSDGYILTVAHAVIPNRHYSVTFPDGKECIAKALGRLDTEASTERPDVAVMKILNSGTWPFAEMGWSYSLKIDQPCFGVSYPESLAQLKPMIRFGTIQDTMNRWGFIESSCIMETGDSGGPLFDYMGRVIGLHSRINKPEAANYEVPVDIYRKYWTALNTAQNYNTLPSTEDDLKKDTLLGETFINLHEQNIKWANLKNVEGKTVEITSSLGDSMPKIYGTLFVKERLSSRKGARNTLVVSKSSMVGENPEVLLPDGKKVKADILSRDSANDFVLLSIAASLPSGITIKTFDTSHLYFSDLGKFLFSVLPEKRIKSSIVGSTFFALPSKFIVGHFGAAAVFKNGKVTLTRIQTGSPAAIEGLVTGDAILSINGTPLHKPEDYGRELRKYPPGEKVNFQCMRGDSIFSKSIELAQPVNAHIQDRFEGGKSIRRDNFQTVFVHDARIKSYECGGPVFDAAGSFRGINIARFSHTTTVIIPSAVIYSFMKTAFIN